MFDCRCFWFAKEEKYRDEYEDAVALKPESGIAAIADGVAQAMFSKEWAQLLTEALVEGCPNIENSAEFHDWLMALRSQWSEAVAVHKLDYWQRRKMEEVGGAYATLLWIEVSPLPTVPDEPEGVAAAPYRYRAFAVGDCCLFHARGDRTICTFPMMHSADFNLHPCQLGSAHSSLDKTHEALSRLRRTGKECRKGDWLILASDAFAQWALQQMEQQGTSSAVCWDEFWGLSEQAWSEKIRALRAARAIRIDDTTLVMLRIGVPRLPSEPAKPLVEDAEAAAVMEPPSLLSGQIVPEDIQAIAGQTNEATRTPSDTPGAQEDMVDEAVDKEPAATFDEDRSGDLWEPSAQPCEDDSNSRQASADSPAYRRPEESAHQSAQPPSVTPESTDALDEPRQTLKPDRCPGSAPLRQEETVAQRHGPWKWLLRCLFGSK